MSVMCIINDPACRVQLLVDEDVYGSEYMRCHPCVNTSSLKIKTSDVFLKLAPAARHSFRVVRV